jgi:fructan beta-fructosidase
MSKDQETQSRARWLARRTMTFVVAALGVGVIAASSAAAASGLTVGGEPFRPVYHYTPAKNFMNDPNGLIFHDGVYHLFYQSNPFGSTAGNGSWGHAVSRDLVHWRELPIAISTDANEDVWSGSVVFDRENTSGLGTRHHAPLVAIYTSFQKSTGVQRQALAYSLDDGMTWTKYAGNPVIDIGSRDFRDPKVFWYAAQRKWVMAVSLAADRKVAIYSSKDLKSWTRESAFGPAGVSSAVWECPDLFPLAVNGNPNDVRWVLSVSVGGKMQYFVGSFDGKTFSSPDATYAPPSGQVLADFEDADYGAWTTTGSAFGQRPATPGADITGAEGHGIADSFGTGDSDTGTLTSPSFPISRRYLNFLIGGGNHPHVSGGSDGPPPGTVFADFEGDTYGPGWTGTGDFVDAHPASENLPGQLGAKVLDTCVGPCDPAKGTIRSGDFTISSPYIDFLIAGGNHPMSGPDPTAVNLVVDGQIVATATGPNGPNMDWVAWNVAALQGKSAHIEVVDQRTADWGHVMVDHIVFSDRAAAPWSAETAVNLLVDGQVVRTATGNNSPNLDWASWDLSDLQGKQAQIQVVDKSTGGWGHIYADQFMAADAPALSTLQRARWIDQGKDFYAGVTYNDEPHNRRIMLGWLGNWDYANSVPTDPWRGAQSVPRQLALSRIGGGVTLLQRPIEELSSLRGKTTRIWPRGVRSATQSVPLRGRAYVLNATLLPGSARRFGVDVRVGSDGQRTRIGYDTTKQTLYIDRTASGQSSFSPLFPSVDEASLPLDGRPLHLAIYVDQSSVEVFANGGRLAMTDLIFPNAASDGVSVFAEDGTAWLLSASATQMNSYLTKSHD